MKQPARAMQVKSAGVGQKVCRKVRLVGAHTPPVEQASGPLHGLPSLQVAPPRGVDVQIPALEQPSVLQEGVKPVARSQSAALRQATQRPLTQKGRAPEQAGEQPTGVSTHVPF
jgi:hypothetical protein